VGVGAITIVGTGSGFSVDFFRGVAAAYLIASNVDVEVLYPETSDKTAGCVIKHGLKNCNASSIELPRNVDFAGINEPFLTADYGFATDLQLFPLAFAGVVPVVNLPFLQPSAASLQSAFVLTPSILAGIFCRKITAWNHTSIIAANKAYASQINALSFGDRKITVVVPSEDAPETLVWTSSLSQFNSTFQSEVGISNNPNSSIWQYTFSRRQSGVGVAAFISSTVGGIGYVQMGIANLYQLYIPKLQTRQNGPALTANLASIAFAGSELGSNFGSDPKDPSPSHYTASLINGPDLEAWPMTLYIYLAVRTKNGLQNDCQSQSAMAKMWYWYLSSPAARRIVEGFGFSYLSTPVQSQVAATFLKTLMCNGELVFQSSVVPAATVLVTPLLSSWFSFVAASFAEIFHQVSFSQVRGNGPIASNHMSIQESAGGIKQLDSGKSFLSLPLFGSAFVFVCNWPVGKDEFYSFVLDHNLISNLLNSNIQNWNDPQIRSLNPFLGNTSHRIVLYMSGQSLSLQKSLLQKFGVTIPLDTNYTSTQNGTLQTLMAVAGTPFSVGFVPFSDKIKSFSLHVFSVKRNDGHVVAPAQSSFSQCAQDTFHLDPVLYYDFPASLKLNCYPLTFSYVLVIPYDFSGIDCATPRSPGYAAAIFLKWLLKRGNLQKVFVSWDTVNNAFPLNIHDNVYREIQQALLQIRCNGHSILAVGQDYNYISAWSVPLATAIFVIVACMGLFFSDLDGCF